MLGVCELGDRRGVSELGRGVLDGGCGVLDRGCGVLDGGWGVVNGGLGVLDRGLGVLQWSGCVGDFAYWDRDGSCGCDQAGENGELWIKISIRKVNRFLK